MTPFIFTPVDLLLNVEAETLADQITLNDHRIFAAIKVILAPQLVPDFLHSS